MRNIQTSRFPGGISVQPEGSILEGLPVPYDQDTVMLFDEFWHAGVTDDPWQVFADGAGAAASAFATGASAMAVFSDSNLGDATAVFIPYFIVEVDSGDPETGIPPTKLEYQVRFSSGQLGVTELAAFGVASLATVQAGDMLANPDEAIQFEVSAQGQVNFAVYRSGVEVYRDDNLFTLTTPEDEYVTCTFKLVDNVITYTVGGGGRGTTDQVPADNNFMTIVACHTETGTAANSASNNVDFVMCAQDLDRTNPTA